MGLHLLHHFLHHAGHNGTFSRFRSRIGRGDVRHDWGPWRRDAFTGTSDSFGLGNLAHENRSRRDTGLMWPRLCMERCLLYHGWALGASNGRYLIRCSQHWRAYNILTRLLLTNRVLLHLRDRSFFLRLCWLIIMHSWDIRPFRILIHVVNEDGLLLSDRLVL